MTLRGSDASKVSQPTTWGTPHSRGSLYICLRGRGTAASGTVDDDQTGWEILCGELGLGSGKPMSSRRNRFLLQKCCVAVPSVSGFQNNHALFSPGSAAQLRCFCFGLRVQSLLRPAAARRRLVPSGQRRCSRPTTRVALKPLPQSGLLMFQGPQQATRPGPRPGRGRSLPPLWSGSVGSRGKGCAGGTLLWAADRRVRLSSPVYAQVPSGPEVSPKPWVPRLCIG